MTSYTLFVTSLFIVSTAFASYLGVPVFQLDDRRQEARAPETMLNNETNDAETHSPAALIRELRERTAALATYAHRSIAAGFVQEQRHYYERIRRAVAQATQTEPTLPLETITTLAHELERFARAIGRIIKEPTG